MSVRIRLTRAGARHRPFYRIVVTDSRMPRDGRFIATLGTYDPLAKTENIKVDGELVNDWIRKGAKPSEAVKHLLKKAGLTPKPQIVPRKTAERPAAAVPLEELRDQKEEEVVHAEEPVPPDEELPKMAVPKKRASSKPKKPARKGASRKKKTE